MDLQAEMQMMFPKLAKLFLPGQLAEFIGIPPYEIWAYYRGLYPLVQVKFLKPHHRLYRAFTKAAITDPEQMADTLLKAFHTALCATARV